MNKVFLFAITILLSTSVCFAQSSPKTMEKSTGLMGVVKTVSSTQVVVTDPAGKDITVNVSDKTVVQDPMGKPAVLTSLTAGQKIMVKYQAAGGVNTALIIKVRS